MGREKQAEPAVRCSIPIFYEAAKAPLWNKGSLWYGGYSSSLYAFSPARPSSVTGLSQRMDLKWSRHRMLFGPGHVSVRGVLKANLVFLVLSLLACLTLVYPLASAMFG